MPLSIRLTPEEEARLDALAARTGRSKTFYVRQAIETHLNDLEEQYLLGRRGDPGLGGLRQAVPAGAGAVE